MSTSDKDDLWVCAVVAIPKDALPIVAIVKEGTEDECREVMEFFQTHPEQVRITGTDTPEDTKVEFVVCSTSLLGDDWRDSIRNDPSKLMN